MSIIYKLDSYRAYAPSMLCITLGIIMATHGYDKIFVKGVSSFAISVAKLGFPFPFWFAWAAALSEFVGGLFLIVGLFTRWAAFFVACTMTVAVFGVHFKNGLTGQGGYEYPLTLLIVALSLMLTGSGSISIDHKFIKH